MRKDKKNFLIMVLLGKKMRGEGAERARTLGKLGKLRKLGRAQTLGNLGNLGKLRKAQTSSP